MFSADEKPRLAKETRALADRLEFGGAAPATSAVRQQVKSAQSPIRPSAPTRDAELGVEPGKSPLAVASSGPAVREAAAAVIVQFELANLTARNMEAHNAVRALDAALAAPTPEEKNDDRN
jgi:hypothetical protein